MIKTKKIKTETEQELSNRLRLLRLSGKGRIIQSAEKNNTLKKKQDAVVANPRKDKMEENCRTYCSAQIRKLCKKCPPSRQASCGIPDMKFCIFNAEVSLREIECVDKRWTLEQIEKEFIE